MSKETLLNEFKKNHLVEYNIGRKETYLFQVGTDSSTADSVYKSVAKIIDKTMEEFIDSEIKYWINVFDTRPKNRDLESDTIAQNFARIEIDRLEELKKIINK